MKIFNTFGQLAAAKVLTGTPVRVLEPALIDGVVEATGEGLSLLSGNVFVPSFGDQESITARKTSLLDDAFTGGISAYINTYKKDNSGNWLAAADGRTSAVFYAGQVWWPLVEIPYTPGGYLITSWGLPTGNPDILEVTTSIGTVFQFNRFTGLIDGGNSGGSTISDTPPINPLAGNRWTRCSDMKSFLWYVDNNGSQWVEDNPSMGAKRAEQRIPTTVAIVATGAYAVGEYLELTDRAGAKFNVVAGGTPNGYDVINAGNGNVAVYAESSTPNIVHLGARDDRNFDSKGAFEYALLNDIPFTIPLGKNYYISSPIDVTGIGNAVIVGFTLNTRSSSNMDKTKIYAPLGFLKNTGTDRVTLDIRHVMVYGLPADVNGDYSGICLDGRYGGNVTGCTFEQYSRHMANDFAYLLWFEYCRFNLHHTALSLATANGSGLKTCWFGSSGKRAIDMLDPDLVIGPSAIDVNTPFTITSGCNFNIGSNTAQVARLRGSTVVKDSYIEVFSEPTAPDEYMIEYVAGRFDGSALNIHDNEINASGKFGKLLSIVSNNAAGTPVGKFSGEIKDNRIIGFTGDKIISIGDTAGGFGYVSGFKVGRNNGSSAALTDYVEYYNDARSLTGATYYMLSAASTDVRGGSYTRLPLELVQPSGFTSPVVNDEWNRREGGLYRLDVQLLLTTTVDLRNVECRILVNGVVVDSVVTSAAITGIAGTHYYTIDLMWVGELHSAAPVTIEARNGGVITKTRLVANPQI